MSVDFQDFIDDLKNSPSDVVVNRCSRLDLDQEELLLTIRQLLWNEIELETMETRIPILEAAVAFYHGGSLDIVNIRVLLDLFFSSNQINHFQLVGYSYAVMIHENNPGEDIVRFIRDEMREFGVDNFKLRTVLDFVDQLGGEVNQYDSIKSKIRSLLDRPEYTTDIIENTDVEDLQELQYWVGPSTRELIVDEIISRKLTDLPSNYPDLLEYFSNDAFLSNLSANHAVLNDQIATLPPRSIGMEELQDLPGELSRVFLPKFVYSQPELEENIRIFFPGGPHIGHSAIVVKSNFGSFMMDFGLSVVNTSSSRWVPMMEKLDFILVSHAHMDHSGSLPILYGKERKLPWFGLQETRVMTEMLWMDTRNIVKRYTHPDVIEHHPYLKRLISRGSIINALKNFNELNLDETYKILPNVSVKAYNAAHLFGSAGFEVSIGGKRLLYTGDFNLDKGADFPTDCDVSIFDSTYFERYQTYPPPKQGLDEALKSSTRLLIPAFSMGRSQEMLFKLKELEAEKNWKIYLTGMGGRLATKLSMNVGSNRGSAEGGIFIVPSVDPEDFTKNTIVIGGQGMLQAGTSRRLFDATRDDEETSVILCGYQAPNTMGYHLLQNHDHILGNYKQQVRRVKISGHTTGETLDKFMDDLNHQKIMVHAPRGAYENRTRDDIGQPDKFNPLIL